MCKTIFNEYYYSGRGRGFFYTTTDQIEVTHAADTASDSVAKSIMDGIISSFTYSPQTGVVRPVTPAQAISAIEFAGTVNPINIYNNDGTVGSGRVATLTDTLTWTDGSIRRDVNSMNVVEVTQESDFGVAAGGNINLTANTTYVVRGNVTCSNRLTVNTPGISITGINRNLDKLIYTGTGNFITILDADFTLVCWFITTTDIFID